MAGILVRDGTLSFTKLATQQTYSLQHLHVKTGLLTPNQPLTRELDKFFTGFTPGDIPHTQARLQPSQSGQDWTAKAVTLDLLLQPDAATRLQLNSRADVALSRGRGTADGDLVTLGVVCSANQSNASGAVAKPGGV